MAKLPQPPPYLLTTEVIWEVDWALGAANPTVKATSYYIPSYTTLGLSPTIVDHWRVYRATESRSFSDAIDIATVPGAASGVQVSYTDGGATINGVGYTYWIIGFDKSERFATQCVGVAGQAGASFPGSGILVCQNRVNGPGTITGPADPAPGSLPLYVSFPWTGQKCVCAPGSQITTETHAVWGVLTPGAGFLAPGTSGISLVAPPGDTTWNLNAAEATTNVYAADVTAGPKLSPIPFPTLPAVQVLFIGGVPGGDATNWGSGPYSSVPVTTADCQAVYIETGTVYSAADLGPLAPGGRGVPSLNGSSRMGGAPYGPFPVTLPCIPCCDPYHLCKCA